jgi:hypothetical protein
MADLVEERVKDLRESIRLEAEMNRRQMEAQNQRELRK